MSHVYCNVDLSIIFFADTMYATTAVGRQGPAVNTPEAREGRQKAFRYYRFLAVFQFLLGVGLLVCGYLGTKYASEDAFGIPFYIGGFIVGALMLLNGCIGFKIVCKGFDEGNEMRQNELQGCMTCQHVTNMFGFMGCFMGVMWTGVLGCMSDCSEEEENVRYAILAGIAAAILFNIISMYTVCTYGKYFGFIITSHRRAVIVMGNQHNSMFDSELDTGLGGSRGNARMQQLRRENEMLQQQLELQRQVGQPSPVHTGVGIAPPPPPPATYGFTAGPPPPPNIAPPAYSNIEK